MRDIVTQVGVTPAGVEIERPTFRAPDVVDVPVYADGLEAPAVEYAADADTFELAFGGRLFVSQTREQLNALVESLRFALADPSYRGCE
jgi:hypothetical protein